MENLHETKQKSEERFLALVYQWGFYFGEISMKDKNPYVQHTPEWYRWNRGYIDGKKNKKTRTLKSENP